MLAVGERLRDQERPMGEQHRQRLNPGQGLGRFEVAPAPLTRELDSRVSDGIHVRLLWHADEGRVSVAVRDTKTGDAFELSVQDGERALEVFYHPYAHLASRRGDARESLAAVPGERVR
jgi:hypothetical protein